MCFIDTRTCPDPCTVQRLTHTVLYMDLYVLMCAVHVQYAHVCLCVLMCAYMYVCCMCAHVCCADNVQYCTSAVLNVDVCAIL